MQKKYTGNNSLGIEEIIFDEGMKMLDQLGGSDFHKELQDGFKVWPRTSEYISKVYNPNDHSEPTLIDIDTAPAESLKSDRFLTNKSLERKNQNLNGIFNKNEEGKTNKDLQEKVRLMRLLSTFG